MDAHLQPFAPEFLAGKHVIVAGGTSGIGLAIAQGFAALGASVTACGSSSARLKAAKASAPDITFAQLDVKDRAAVAAFMAAQETIDILINAQGIARPEAEWEAETFDEVVDVNMTSAFGLTMAALPKLKASKGSVILVASMLSYLADVEVPAYTASKTGIMGLARALAHRFGPDGIRVNAVAPGYHRTDMTRALWSNPPSEKVIADRAALKRWGEAEDLVGPIVFLCSDAAAFVTGVTLPVDGGFHTGTF
ncbi:SDR family oxidoreductase [Martelella mediterranea]|uniref:SDR family NAD(P)-dependent oxidoreductase n=1 Tax=Martelella mediterranea TaxID=293089 RepID=UPI001E3F8F0C|nr:SDR family oxidoreductase [Martelella mediterranea]MCD1636412.1 SDR family oxidoreductase [Martelella mediterranea]